VEGLKNFVAACLSLWGSIHEVGASLVTVVLGRRITDVTKVWNEESFRTEIRKVFFSMRASKHCSRSSSDIVPSMSLEAFQPPQDQAFSNVV